MRAATVKKVKKVLIILVITLAILLLPVVVIGVRASIETGHSPTAAELERYADLAYFKDGRFQSPEPTPSYPDRVRGGGKGYGWLRFILTGNEHAPKNPLPQVLLKRDSFGQPHESLAAYWLGHSSLIIELEGKRILVDPVFDNAAPVPFVVRRFVESPITRAELPTIDIVLITHDHYDHLEYATMRHLAGGGAIFVVPLGVGGHLKRWGVDEGRIVELGWGEAYGNDTLKIYAERTIHYAGRTFAARNQTLWACYAIIGAKNRVFISGDSGYGDHFKAIGNKYGAFDFAFIEIDGWNPGWPKTHMFPEEVLQTYKDINARAFVPVHWGVFDLAIHAWDESIKMVDQLVKDDQNITMITPLMGQKFILHETNTTKWWL